MLRTTGSLGRLKWNLQLAAARPLLKGTWNVGRQLTLNRSLLVVLVGPAMARARRIASFLSWKASARIKLNGKCLVPSPLLECSLSWTALFLV